MKKLLVLMLLIATLIIAFWVVSSLNTAFEVDELWQKAQAMAENSWRLVPGQVTMIVESISDDDSIVNSSTKTVFVNSLGEYGTIISERIDDLTIEDESIKAISHSHDSYDCLSTDAFMLPALSNIEGIDSIRDLMSSPNVRVMTLSGDQMPDLEELQAHGIVNIQMHEIGNSPNSEAGTGLTPKREGIFFETNKHNLTLRRQRSRKVIDDRLCQGYSFKYTPFGSSELQEGVVWLDITTGAPVLKEIGSPKKFFSPSSVSTTIHIGFNEVTNQFFMERKEEKTSIAIPIVGINMNIHSIRIEENHWEYPTGE